ncbi:hypothetical protein VLK31_07030 [Variovorax sp. H27-G14]|uniref:hypothetical protein n=1 Tax=Variovorax sp. H27-G14 TaxID=3111914 RepID=UPI0038FD19F4
MESEQMVGAERWSEIRVATGTPMGVMRSGVKVVEDAPLFDISGPDGEHFKLWADGRFSGFKAGTQVVVNHGARLEFFEVMSDPQ